MRLHFSIGCYDHRRTTRFRQSIHFSRIEILFADHVHRRSGVDNKFSFLRFKMWCRQAPISRKHTASRAHRACHSVSSSICDNQVQHSSDESPHCTIPTRSWVSQTLVFLICTTLPRCHQMRFSSLITTFRHTFESNSEYHHFEEQLYIGWHNSRQNHWLQWPRSTRRSGKGSVFGLFVPPDWFFFWSENYGWFCSMLKQSSHRGTSKSGFRIPLTDNEDMKLSTESTISTSLIQCIASVGNCEQVHTSVLNLIFQQANVAGVGKLTKQGSEICSLCWSAAYFFVKSSLIRVEWMSGWRSWLASRIQSCVWILTFTRHMRWYVFRYVRNQGLNHPGSGDEEDAGGFTKTFPEKTCVSQKSGGLSLRLSIPRGRLSIPPGFLRKWEKRYLTGNTGLSTAYWFSIFKNLPNHSCS